MVVVTLALGCAEPPRHRSDPPFGSELVGVSAPSGAGEMGGQFGDEGDPRPHEFAGRVVIWPGAAALAGGEVGVDRAAVFLDGDPNGRERFGTLLTAADLDGDGLLDLLAGDEELSPDSEVLSFPGARLLDPTLTTLDGGTALVGLSDLLRPVGDLDGDGADEVGHSPWGYPWSFLHRVYRGPDLEQGTTVDPSWLAVRFEQEWKHGDQAPLALGDLDHDGITEVAVDEDREDGLVVRVLAGSTLASGGEVLVEADALTIDLGAHRGPAGSQLDVMALVGDLDGDGLDELALGVATPYALDRGHYDLFLFAGRDLGHNRDLDPSDALATLSHDGDDLGFTVGPMPDLDADGHEELAVRIVRDDRSTFAGWISGTRLARGAMLAPDDLDVGPARLTTCEHHNGDVNAYSYERDALVDLDGDDLSDWLVPGDGGVCVYRGVDLADPGWSGEPFAVLDAGTFASIVVPLSDLDGDGVPELAVGFPTWDP